MQELDHSTGPRFPSLAHVDLQLHDTQESPFIALPVYLTASAYVLRVQIGEATVYQQFQHSTLGKYYQSDVQVYSSVTSTQEGHVPATDVQD